MEPTLGRDAATMYLYIDEAGNPDFGEHGTRFFTLTGVVMRRPFRQLSGLPDAKYDALEAGLDLEYFHASEDRQAVRDEGLARLEPCLSDLALPQSSARVHGLAGHLSARGASASRQVASCMLRAYVERSAQGLRARRAASAGLGPLV